MPQRTAEPPVSPSSPSRRSPRSPQHRASQHAHLAPTLAGRNLADTRGFVQHAGPKSPSEVPESAKEEASHAAQDSGGGDAVLLPSASPTSTFFRPTKAAAQADRGVLGHLDQGHGRAAGGTGGCRLERSTQLWETESQKTGALPLPPTLTSAARGVWLWVAGAKEPVKQSEAGTWV